MGTTSVTVDMTVKKAIQPEKANWIRTWKIFVKVSPKNAIQKPSYTLWIWTQAHGLSDAGVRLKAVLLMTGQQGLLLVLQEACDVAGTCSSRWVTDEGRLQHSLEAVPL
jgi:hypothetical protein